MGTTTPGSWPVIDVTKFYCVTTDYFTGFPQPDCSSPFVRELNCCVWGQVLYDFIVYGKECTPSGNLCAPGGGTIERIVGIKGPYDTSLACAGDCP